MSLFHVTAAPLPGAGLSEPQGGRLDKATRPPRAHLAALGAPQVYGELTPGYWR